MTDSKEEVHYLQVYNQTGPHDQVMIVGDAVALERLAHCLLAAAKGQNASCKQYCSDGEGYAVICINTDYEAMESIALPYSEDMFGYSTKGPHTLISKSEYRRLATDVFL